MNEWQMARCIQWLFAAGIQEPEGPTYAQQNSKRPSSLLTQGLTDWETEKCTNSTLTTTQIAVHYVGTRPMPGRDRTWPHPDTRCQTSNA